MRRTPLLLYTVALFTACTPDASPGGTGALREERQAMPAVAPSNAARARDLEMAAAANAVTVVSAPPQRGDATLFSSSSVADSVVSSMLIRTGQANVQVDSLDRGIRAVRELAARVGGYVANSSILAGAEQTHTATLELKIPAAHFDAALDGLPPIGSLESVNVSAEDVGEEYVDVAARAASERRLEQRLIEILGTRTGKLGDVLAVERELARVREEIERQEGRMRYLRTRAALSTLAITVHEKLPVVAGTGSGGVLAEAFRQAWRNFIGLTAGFIAALGMLVPLGALVAAIGWGVWRARRRNRVPGGEAAT